MIWKTTTANISKHLVAIVVLVLASKASVAQTDNKALVKVYFDALSRQDVEVLSKMAADSFVFNDFTTGVTLRNKEEALKYFEKIRQQGNKGRFTIRSMFRVNNWVWSIAGSWDGVINQRPVRARFSTTLVFDKNGKVTRQTDHFDVSSFALAQFD